MQRSERGSLSERLRSLQIRDSIIRKQDEMPADADPAMASVQTQAPMNMPSAGPAKSPIGMKMDEIDSSMSTLAELIVGVNQDLSTASAHNVDMRVLGMMQNDLLKLQQFMAQGQSILRALKEKHGSLAQHDVAAMNGGGMMGMGGM